MKFSLSSFVRAIVWLLFGIFFGFALVWLVLMSSVIFVRHHTYVKVSDLLHEEFVVFLGVALMGGVFSDYVLSVNFEWPFKLINGLTVIMACMVVFYIFNPEVEVRPAIKKEFTFWFCAGCIVFCLCLKTIMFYNEEYAHKKLKYRI